MPQQHHCHLPGCQAACPPRHLFCAPHWRLVPKAIQAEVYATVRKRNKGSVDASWAPWWRAQADATVAVLRILHPDDEERIAKWLAREQAVADKMEGDA
jgi:hypothetical protein